MVDRYGSRPVLRVGIPLLCAALMAKGLKDIDWDDLTEAAPALITRIADRYGTHYEEGAAVGLHALFPSAEVLADAGQGRELRQTVDRHVDLAARSAERRGKAKTG